MSLSKEKFAGEFGTHWPKIEPFFDNGGFEPIYEKLKQDSVDGRVIAPLSKDTFKCFMATPLEDMKVVLMGMSPYHTKHQGVIVADGLLMSCSNTGRLQPSLEQYYEAIETEYKDGLCLPCERDPDLYWLASQGVLMFNASLTTEINKAGSHEDLWEPFTNHVMDNIIAPSGVPVIFLGKSAGRFAKRLAPMQWGFKVSHPASAAYNMSQWDSEGVFTKVDKIIRDKGESPIVWIKGGLPF